MDLRELTIFYHVANLRSVSKTATKVNLSQPTISSHLRRLETEFGATFIDRISRPVRLTPEGRTFLELVTPVIKALDALKTQMEHPEHRGSFLVGAYPDLVRHHLPTGVHHFRALFPDVRIRLVARPYASLIQMVKSGELEVAFCSPPPADDPSFEFQELFLNNVVLATPTGHPLLERHLIQLQDIVKWPLILSGPESITRQMVEQALQSQALKYDVVLEMDDTESIKRYVGIGMGLAMCSDFNLHAQDRDKLGVVRLDHIFPSSAIGICTLKGKYIGAAVRNFIETMSNQLRGFHADLGDWMNPSENQEQLASDWDEMSVDFDRNENPSR